MNYDTVYLPKNRFITSESMATGDYAALFFPFESDGEYKSVTPKKWYVGEDWTFSFCASFLYCEETDPLMQELHRKAISAFDGIAPTYHIELFDKPTLVWDFHLLLSPHTQKRNFAVISVKIGTMSTRAGLKTKSRNVTAGCHAIGGFLMLKSGLYQGFHGPQNAHFGLIGIKPLPTLKT